MHSHSFLPENNNLVRSKMLERPSSDMFNLRIRVCSRKNREYLQKGSSNPSGKWCNRIFGSFLRRKQLTILLGRADHPKVPLPPKITTVPRTYTTLRPCTYTTLHPCTMYIHRPSPSYLRHTLPFTLVHTLPFTLVQCTLYSAHCTVHTILTTETLCVIHYGYPSCTIILMIYNVLYQCVYMH